MAVLGLNVSNSPHRFDRGALLGVIFFFVWRSIPFAFLSEAATVRECSGNKPPEGAFFYLFQSELFILLQPHIPTNAPIKQAVCRFKM